jgi:16S rRNA (guanine(966)-N(2))-methyltransferase RsmD
LRIIGGEWKRRLLPIVNAEGLRPTPDRVRETLFNWLAHAFGGDFSDLSVLDLFAGTGALGIEAASRGAASVLLVEKNRDAASGLRAVRASLGAMRIDIREGDAVSIARELQQADKRFDLVFLDPPFSHQWIDTALPLAAQLASPRGFIYVESERPIEESILAPLDLAIYREDKAGEVFYHLLRRNK